MPYPRAFVALSLRLSVVGLLIGGLVTAAALPAWGQKVYQPPIREKSRRPTAPAPQATRPAPAPAPRGSRQPLQSLLHQLGSPAARRSASQHPTRQASFHQPPGRGVPMEGPMIEGPYVDGEIIEGPYMDGQIVDGPMVDDYFEYDEPSLMPGPAPLRIGGVGMPTLGDRLYARGEYLQWWTQGNSIPPLVTSGLDRTSIDRAGVLDQAGTQILFGGSHLSDDSRSGVRVALGYWLDPAQMWAAEVDYLWIENASGNFSASGDESAVLSRPFVNAQTGAQDAQLVAFPNVLSGQVDIAGTSKFDSLEFLLRRVMVVGDNFELDLLGGYRFARLDDRLHIAEALVSLDPSSGIAQGTTIDLFDEFSTGNEFHGLLAGVAGRMYRESWILEMQATLAIGNSSSYVNVNGATRVVTPNVGVASSPGGLLAQSTNIGRVDQDDFAVLPELSGKLHYDFGRGLVGSVGYNFLYWSRVARSGDQIDTNVNLSQLPPGPLVGPRQPQPRFVTNDYWAQGLSFSLLKQF